jgi:diacylglycerol kinase family enzyme
MSRRAAALLALVATATAIALACYLTVRDFPRGVPAVFCALVAGAVAWKALARRSRTRAVGLVVAAGLLVGALVLTTLNGRLLEDGLLAAAAVVAVVAARTAFAAPVKLPAAESPRRATLFWNPRSGGGKATRFHLAEEARRRGIEPVELKPGDDLEELARRAVDAGADGLAMAGGDGSQAIVARFAADNGLPYACIPAGTRNHFALDLGVDRDDVVGALDAFVDGRERRVDLAEVNGRVFVNNVSLGVYADAVQQPGYREAKLRTIMATLPEVVESGNGNGNGLHWTGPDGEDEHSMAAVLVSNNAYRLGRAIGSGTRPRVDGGVLGVAVFDAPGAAVRRRPWREWSTPSFEVRSDHPVNAGIDGEAAVLDPPLRFTVRPRVLRARIAARHPGASPSASVPDDAWSDLKALGRIALGRRE